MTTVVRTDRVALREFHERDLDVVAKLMADEEQMSLYPRPRTREESRAWIHRNLDFYKERGFGFWLMESGAVTSSVTAASDRSVSTG